MSRLTTNKPVDECSMLELAYNSCYAKDGKARYRDYEMNMDARDFARNLMVTLTGEELPLDDEAFDEEMYDNLQYDQFSNVKGLIALFYRNLWAMADLRETLKAYEDKQEQGLLIEPKCSIGSYVYYPVADYNYIFPVRISQIVMSDLGDGKRCFQYNGAYFDGNGDPYDEYEFDDDDFGEIVFLTESEAEEAPVKMREENNG